jgi:hypothetical protein
VPGEHLDAVRQLEQAPQRVEEALGALLRADGEVGPRRVADEERVARQDEPRLVRARAVDHREAGVLRPVAGCVDRAQHDLAQLDLGAVLQRVVVELGRRRGVDRDRHAVLEREAAVAREMVGVGVRLDGSHDRDAPPPRRLEHGLDRERRVDDRGDAGILVADQVGSAPEIVVQKLLEEHGF